MGSQRRALRQLVEAGRGMSSSRMSVNSESLNLLLTRKGNRTSMNKSQVLIPAGT